MVFGAAVCGNTRDSAAKLNTFCCLFADSTATEPTADSALSEGSTTNEAMAGYQASFVSKFVHVTNEDEDNRSEKFHAACVSTQNWLSS